jgi:hypothetical protein
MAILTIKEDVMPISAYQVLNVLNNYSRQIIEDKQGGREDCRIVRFEVMRQSIIEKVSGDLIRSITETFAKQKEEFDDTKDHLPGI